MFILKMARRKCNQMKCGFNIMGGCRACQQCNAPPNIVDEDCDVCWNCENDEGLLRWDDSVPYEEEEQKEKEEDKKIELTVPQK
jgi:hypothetical protein